MENPSKGFQKYILFPQLELPIPFTDARCNSSCPFRTLPRGGLFFFSDPVPMASSLRSVFPTHNAHLIRPLSYTDGLTFFP